MATSSRRNLKQGGYIAPFNSTPDNNSYLLYNPATTTATTSNSYGINLFPGMKGGNPNTDGGCATCGMSGGARKKRATKATKATKATRGKKGPKNGGMGLELAPFMSALALLGARLLADKELGIFNNKKPAQQPTKKTTSRSKKQ
jgi:hypothetical protein